MQIGPLNHVGIAVPNLEDAMDTYRTLYGATDIPLYFTFYFSFSFALSYNNAHIHRIGRFWKFYS